MFRSKEFKQVIAAGAANAVEIKTAIADGDYGVVTFNITGHGLATGKVIVMEADGDMDEFRRVDISTIHTVTVIDEDSFSITLANNGAGPQAIGAIAGGDVPNISIRILANSEDIRDLLDENLVGDRDLDPDTSVRSEKTCLLGEESE